MKSWLIVYTIINGHYLPNPSKLISYNCRSDVAIINGVNLANKKANLGIRYVVTSCMPVSLPSTTAPQ